MMDFHSHFFIVKCPEGWQTLDNSCYKLETSVDLKIGQDQGMEHCRNKYNGYMAVINSKEEAVFLTSFLSGVTVSKVRF